MTLPLFAEAAAPPSPLASPGRLLAVLERWADAGWLRPLDAAFAGFLAREVPDASPAVLLAAALASHQLGRGHACLDLAATLADPALALSLPPEGAVRDAALPHPAALLAGLEGGAWQAALADRRLVGCGEAGETSPLVCVGERLYLRRYWQYEEAVRAGVAARLAEPPPVDAEALRASLRVLFPEADAALDWQALACALAARSRFAVITGGPGSGKTTTVVCLLALLQAQALGSGGQPLAIRLAAPTGKAAARLDQSIAQRIDALPLDGLGQGEAVRAAIPRRVVTLHRLLGSRPDGRRFQYHASHPLPVDVLVIDEASMVDLEMMAAVLAALPPAARLILLGDKDQLASVEAGAVLGQLCRHAAAGRYTPATADWLARVLGQAPDAAWIDAAGTPLDQAVAMLRVSRRFDSGSGIGRLAAAVNAGDVPALASVLAESPADLAVVDLAAARGAADAAWQTLVAGATPDAGYRAYLARLAEAPPPSAPPAAFDAWAHSVLAAHGRFQVLCALRRGPWGVEGLNARIAGLLHAAGWIRATEGWYPGRPVLVTRNDHALGLMNGDIGITLAVPLAGGGSRLRVAFPEGDGGVRWVLPTRLSAVETVYALTVHKAQGSEFTHAVLVLPDRANPILTRELVYTGITRARERFTLAGIDPAGRLAEAAGRRILRAGGLAG